MAARRALGPTLAAAVAGLSLLAAAIPAHADRPQRRAAPLWGIADPHVHVTANLRAGGRVISGEPFHPDGMAAALGRDAEVHGPQGALDVTGNLLRSGVPTGTHAADGWPSFESWPTHDTITHQQVHWRWLRRAWRGGLRLIVAQTVEDEPLCRLEPLRSHSCDEMDTVELQVAQLRALQDHVDARAGGPGRGFLRIVTRPRQARRVIDRGRLAVVIGAETSNPFGCRLFRGIAACDAGDVDRGIDRMHALGVRSMFVAHWVDNALAGAALEGGDKGLFIGAMQLAYTGSAFRTGPCPLPGQGEEVVPAVPEPLNPLLTGIGALSPEPLPLKPAGRQCNTRGLTPLGEHAVRRMMERGMLVEVDHLSEPARARVLEIATELGRPAVSSHTGTGGTWHPSEIERLYAAGGFASARLAAADALPGDVLALRAPQRRRTGIGLSTDTGGFAELPGPPQQRLAYPFRSLDGRRTFARQRTGTRTFDLNTDGVAHYGLVPDHLALTAAQPGGRRAVRLLTASARAYVRTWRRAVR